MIDLHSHILPGIDDGAADLATAMKMAELAVADGITTMACTPHILPGLYRNDSDSIARAIATLSAHLRSAKIPLELVAGADVHVAPDLLEKLQSGVVPTLNGSRYFLLEPPHDVAPQWIEDLAHRLLEAGFIPIITHPERLAWIETHFPIVARLNEAGCRIQITAGSLLGSFGNGAKIQAERLLAEKRVDVVATDAHGTGRRTPGLRRARRWLANRVGESQALEMVLGRPRAILADEALPPVRPVPRTRGLLDRALDRLSGGYI